MKMILMNIATELFAQINAIFKTENVGFAVDHTRSISHQIKNIVS